MHMKKMRSAFMVMLGLLWSYTTIAQQQVSGTVTDANTNEPLVGVNVVVKGTQEGTITDFNGQYSITVNPGDVLHFSYLGYDPVEVVVERGVTEYNVAMKPSNVKLKEVVVTALGITREKKALGYSLSEVGSEEIQSSGNANVIGALQGRVPGLIISQASGTPGAGVNILLRGITSLDPGRSNRPLVIVDGIEISDDAIVAPITSDKVSLGVGANSSTQGAISNRAMDLDPNDIENISILKGAAAAALYGARAANGVIIITTKKGQKGDPTVTFNYGTGWSNMLKWPKVQTQFIDGHRNHSRRRYRPDRPYRYPYGHIRYWDSWGSPYTDRSKIVLEDGRELAPHDVYKEFYRTGTNSSYNLGITAGTDRFKYRLSGSHLKSKGITPNTYWQRSNLSLSSTYKVNPKLEVEGSLMYAKSGGNKPHEGRKSVVNVLSYMNVMIPQDFYIQPYSYRKNFSYSIIDHPLYLARKNLNLDDVDRIINSLNAKYQFSSNLSLNYRVGLDIYNDNRTRIVDPETDEGTNMRGFIVENNLRKRSLTSNLSLNYTTSLTDNINVNFLVGHYLYGYDYKRVTVRGETFVLPTFYNLNNTTFFYQSNALVRYRNMALYGQVSMDYARAIYLTLTGRNDWSSTLPEQNNSYFFPSAELSLLLSELMDLPDVINYFKVRGSYAVVGKDADPYKIGRYYNLRFRDEANGILGFGLSTIIGDENLRPEFTKSLEIGGEITMLNNRLTLEGSWYRSNITDMILSVPISNTTGASRLLTNAGALKTYGYEAVATLDILRGEGLNWTTRLMYSKDAGEVVSIAEDIDEIVLFAARNVYNKYVPGGKIGDLYGHPFRRTEDGQLIIDEKTGYPHIDRDTLVLMGNAFPDFIASWYNDFSFKGFSFNFLWEWKKGGMAVDVSRPYRTDNGQTVETLDRHKQVIFKGVVEKVDQDGNVTYVENTKPVEVHPAAFYRHYLRYRYAPERLLTDASWIRLRSISLSYDVPQRLLQNTFIKKLKITFTGNNVFLNTPYVGFDPELNYLGSASNIYGFTGLRTPSVKSFMFNFNFTF